MIESGTVNYLLEEEDDDTPVLRMVQRCRHCKNDMFVNGDTVTS